MAIDDWLCAHIENVLRKYASKPEQLKPDFESRLVRAVTTIAGAKVTASRSLPLKFRDIGRRETDKELDEFAAGLQKAIAAIDRMHYPARSTIAMAGLGPAMHLRSRLETIHKSVCAIDTSDIPKNPKQRATRSRHGLIFTLGRIYRDFGGRGLMYSEKEGGFALFVCEMFGALKMRKPSKYEVQKACRFFDEKV